MAAHNERRQFAAQTRSCGYSPRWGEHCSLPSFASLNRGPLLATPQPRLRGYSPLRTPKVWSKNPKAKKCRNDCIFLNAFVSFSRLTPSGPRFDFWVICRGRRPRRPGRGLRYRLWGGETPPYEPMENERQYPNGQPRTPAGGYGIRPYGGEMWVALRS